MAWERHGMCELALNVQYGTTNITEQKAVQET
jgi:hypothetical protein